MSFGNVLLEEGVEVELKTGLQEVMAILDQEVPDFTHNGYGYQVSSMKGVVGSRMQILIKPWDRDSGVELAPAVGYIDVYAVEGGSVNFRIPPRDEWGDEEAVAFDEDGKFFSSFISQILNAFQDKGLLRLPGQIPVQ